MSGFQDLMEVAGMHCIAVTMPVLMLLLQLVSVIRQRYIANGHQDQSLALLQCPGLRAALTWR